MKLVPVTVPAITINLGDKALIEAPAKAALELAQGMEIDCLDMANQAQEEIALWAKQQAQVETWRKEITVPIDAAKKHVMDFVRTANDTFTEAGDILKGKIAAWQRAERDRVAREQREREEAARRERDRLEAEAREADRKAKEAAAESARKEREAQETNDAAAAAQLRAEAEAKAREAEEHRGEAANSAAIAQVIVAAPAREAPKVAGMRFSETVEVKVVDMVALVQWIGANPAFIHLLDANLSNLKALQKAMKDKFNVPGVQVTKDLGAGRSSKAA